jgi:aspartyl protease
MRTVCACAAGLLIAACAHDPPPLHSTRLVVQHSGGGFFPYVRAKVAGHPMTFLLDTGASRSFLPRGFVQAHNLPMRSRANDERIIDSNGRISVLPLLTGVPVQFEGEAGAGKLDFLMSSSDSTSEGILAPQDIVRSGSALVIDLGREQLSLEPEEAARKRLSGDASPPLRELDFHRCLTEGLFERSHRIVSATINGVPADMLIDTGASRTALARNNPALPSMLAAQGKRGSVVAIGSTGQALLVPDVPVVVSQTSFVLPVLVIPASQTCWQGALGSDVLRHCTLVWGYSSLWAACRAPALP